MNQTPPPTAVLQEPDVIAAAAIDDYDAAAAAEAIRSAIGRWLDRTQRGAFRIPFVSDLLERVLRPAS